MTLYKIGEIVYKNNNNIILESKGEGNLVTICDNSRYSKGEKLKYIYTKLKMIISSKLMDLKLLKKGCFSLI